MYYITFLPWGSLFGECCEGLSLSVSYILYSTLSCIWVVKFNCHVCLIGKGIASLELLFQNKNHFWVNLFLNAHYLCFQLYTIYCFDHKLSSSHNPILYHRVHFNHVKYIDRINTFFFFGCGHITSSKGFLK